MKTSQRIGTALRCGTAITALAIAAMTATAASAQGTPAATTVDPNAPAAAPTTDSGSDIIVTGTRISGVTNANNPSPISVTTKEQIDETRATAVEDVLQRMVGVDGNAIGNASNNGGIGLSQVSLRDLGAQRALVLVDGTRLIPSTGTVPDTNSIPLNMVERVDVLRDGASSVYGADAIGGVVNIITKRKADGFHFDAGGGLTQHGGGEQWNVGARWGASHDRGSVLIGANWEHHNAINGYQRDWANDPHIGGNFEGGSVYRTQIDVLQAQGAVTLRQNTTINGVLIPAGTTVGARDDDGVFIPVGGFGGTLVSTGGQFFTTGNPALANLAPNTLFLPNVGVVKLNANGSKATPWNTLQGSIDRKSFNYAIDYDLAEGITLFSDGFYTKRTSRQLLRPEPLLGDQIANGTYPGFIIPAAFPGNPTTGDYGAFLIPVQFGPRDYRQNSDTLRVRAGFKGEIFGDFRYEIAGVEQQNDLQAKVLNTGNFLSLGQLTGQLPCISVPGGCTGGLPNVYPGFFTAAPDAIFNPAQLDYAKYTQVSTNELSERYVYGNINGSLFQLPGGAAKIALGAEYRGEHYTFTPDALVIAGFAPNQSFPTDGGYNVKSAYGELFLPILSDLPGAYRLELTPSARIDDYSNFGTAKTWKIGANYAPIEDIRFRGSYSTGFRAPQVAELFGGTFLTNLTASGDPCETFINPAAIDGNPNIGQGLLTAGSTCAQALNGGAALLPNTFHDPLDDISQQQIQVLAGGNPNLQPEKSRGYNAGVVLQPRFARGLTLSFDYYRTKVKNQILPGGLAGSVGADFILLNCYGPAQDANYCAKISRTPSGTIQIVESLADNTGTNTVRGYDIQATFDSGRANMDLPFGGRLGVDLQLSRQIQNDVLNPDGSITHYAGNFSYDNLTVHPKWRGLINVDWDMTNWGLHYDAQYSSALHNYDGSDFIYGNRINARWMHAVSAWLGFHDFAGIRQGRIIVGVDNLFDKDPPFLGAELVCKCNSFAGPYDFGGRSFFARLSMDFNPPPLAPAPPPYVPPPPPPPAPPPATQTCADGSVILATDVCPVPPPPPPPPAPEPERG